MRQQPHLSDFFAKARSEPSVVSEQEIDRLLDAADLHGRQSAAEGTSQTTAYSYNRKRRIIMGSIAALLFGSFVSAGVFFFSPEDPQHTTPPPAVAEVSTPKANALPSEAKERPVAVESTTTIPAPIENSKTSPSIESLNGRGKDGTAIIPAGKEEKDKEKKNDEDGSKIEEEISKELQTFVETYWLDKINGYKAHIDGLMSSSERNELDRLRVRWALVDKEEDSFDFAAMMSMSGVNAKGEKAQVSTTIGNSGNIETIDINGDDSEGKGKVSLALSLKSDDVNEEVSASEEGTKRVIRRQHTTIALNNEEGLSLTEEEGTKAEEVTIMINDEDGEGAKQGNRTLIVRRNAAAKDGDPSAPQSMPAIVIIGEDDEMALAEDENGPVEITIDEDKDMISSDGGKHKVIVRRQVNRTDAKGMSEGLDLGGFNMGSLAEMVKMSIRADKNESSQIMVAAWDLADEHRAGMDDLKAMVSRDVTVFISTLREKMSDFVAEHGDEIPVEMRDAIKSKLNDEELGKTADQIVKSLDPFYNVVVEPMIILYNGSDINGVLTSAIAEPVAGITLDANATLKQSYPNPASTEATIEYALRESSSATVLRLFDSQGSEVRNQNLGAQEAGNHRTTIDVRDLPGGTYLYHLTIGTPRGEQVFSKTMQITR